MEPCPFDNTKRSRSHQRGLPGLCFKKSFQSTSAMSAMPMGAPGWPELAACTASIESARIAFASRRRFAAASALLLVGIRDFRKRGPRIVARRPVAGKQAPGTAAAGLWPVQAVNC